VCADGSKLPFPDKSIDVAIFNHIYEHVVDPDAIMSEIRRVLRDDGAVYLGFANRMGIMEPHYRLPFLSWLPRRLAHRYVALSRRAPSYYEKFRTKPGLRRMCAGLRVWDYTYTVLSDAERFRARDMVPARLDKLPPPLWHALAPIMPTYIWVGTPGSRQPSGTPTRHAPRLLRTKR
jgi:SAM-dependent methyltransferase